MTPSKRLKTRIRAIKQDKQGKTCASYENEVNPDNLSDIWYYLIDDGYNIIYIDKEYEEETKTDLVFYYKPDKTYTEGTLSSLPTVNRLPS